MRDEWDNAERIRQTQAQGAYEGTMETLRQAEREIPDFTSSYDGEMRDTVGQAAALTGGYGSSYAESVGQQQYGAYLQKLSERIPELYQAAWERYRDEGDALRGQLETASGLARAEYDREKDRRQAASQAEQQDYERRWKSYQNLISLISKSGYEPESAELAAAGMSKAQADALRNEYLRVNGLLPVAAGGGGGGIDYYWGGGGGSSSKTNKAAGTGAERTKLAANAKGSGSGTGKSRRT